MKSICEDCGKLTDTIEDRCECGGWFVEARLCEVCGEVYITDEDDLCEECLKTSSTLENCLDIGDDEAQREQYKLNGFLASVFSEREIEELALKCFMELPKHLQQEYINSYCGSDTYFLVNYLKVKIKNVNLH